MSVCIEKTMLVVCTKGIPPQSRSFFAFSPELDWKTRTIRGSTLESTQSVHIHSLSVNHPFLPNWPSTLAPSLVICAMHTRNHTSFRGPTLLHSHPAHISTDTHIQHSTIQTIKFLYKSRNRNTTAKVQIYPSSIWSTCIRP